MTSKKKTVHTHLYVFILKQPTDTKQDLRWLVAGPAASPQRSSEMLQHTQTLQFHNVSAATASLRPFLLFSTLGSSYSLRTGQKAT